MKTFLFFALASLSSYAQAAIFLCEGSSANTLPANLTVEVYDQTLKVQQLNIVGSRIIKNQPADKMIYLAVIPSSADTAVAIWSYLSSVDTQLELSVPTPMGTLSKTYECSMDVPWQ